MSILPKTTMFISLAVGFVSNLLAQNRVVSNVGNKKFNEFTLNYNPLSVAISNDHQSAYWPQPYLERWRIVTDLNGDGKDDLILFDTKDTFGNAGGGYQQQRFLRCVGDVRLKHNEQGVWTRIGNGATSW